jgi:hypothetical protein
MDSKKKYEQMIEDGEIVRTGGELYQVRAKYIWVLDFGDGKVYRYKISGNYFEIYPHDWNPDHEACEEFLTESGHNLTNCEWMVTSENKPINNNLINYKTNTNNPG